MSPSYLSSNLNCDDQKTSLSSSSSFVVLEKGSMEFEAASLADYQQIQDDNCSVVILCSSDTTGLPKGVMLSHKNMLAIISAMESPQFCGDLKNGTVFIDYGYGLAIMLSIISRGLTVVSMSLFDPQLFCQTIQKYRIKSIPLVPPIMSFLAKHPMK
ncbi:hypothetical protein HCN44_007870 [Aphidius gifuensis]|uniref:AMP-dependent synthetase/ligase domain-containing protein n=1 Tax=Aphidius gifuensis TaxID=684658 RepID=A0A834XXC1_APHGI|nr:hypothetical protein HCN44_007870 [Aphidius gifuensis]